MKILVSVLITGTFVLLVGYIVLHSNKPEQISASKIDIGRR